LGNFGNSNQNQNQSRNKSNNKGLFSGFASTSQNNRMSGRNFDVTVNARNDSRNKDDSRGKDETKGKTDPPVTPFGGQSRGDSGGGKTEDVGGGEDITAQVDPNNQTETQNTVTTAQQQFGVNVPVIYNRNAPVLFPPFLGGKGRGMGANNGRRKLSIKSELTFLRGLGR
jgi:hypothetical protein